MGVSTQEVYEQQMALWLPIKERFGADVARALVSGQCISFLRVQIDRGKWLFHVFETAKTLDEVRYNLFSWYTMPNNTKAAKLYSGMLDARAPGSRNYLKALDSPVVNFSLMVRNEHRNQRLRKQHLRALNRVLGAFGGNAIDWSHQTGVYSVSCGELNTMMAGSDRDVAVTHIEWQLALTYALPHLLDVSL